MDPLSTSQTRIELQGSLDELWLRTAQHDLADWLNAVLDGVHARLHGGSLMEELKDGQALLKLMERCSEGDHQATSKVGLMKGVSSVNSSVNVSRFDGNLSASSPRQKFKTANLQMNVYVLSDKLTSFLDWSKALVSSTTAFEPSALLDDTKLDPKQVVLHLLGVAEAQNRFPKPQAVEQEDKEFTASTARAMKELGIEEPIDAEQGLYNLLGVGAEPVQIRQFEYDPMREDSHDIESNGLRVRIARHSWVPLLIYMQSNDIEVPTRPPSEAVPEMVSEEQEPESDTVEPSCNQPDQKLVESDKQELQSIESGTKVNLPILDAGTDEEIELLQPQLNPNPKREQILVTSTISEGPISKTVESSVYSEASTVAESSEAADYVNLESPEVEPIYFIPPPEPPTPAEPIPTEPNPSNPDTSMEPASPRISFDNSDEKSVNGRMSALSEQARKNANVSRLSMLGVPREGQTPIEASWRMHRHVGVLKQQLENPGGVSPSPMSVSVSPQQAGAASVTPPRSSTNTIPYKSYSHQQSHPTAVRRRKVVVTETVSVTYRRITKEEYEKGCPSPEEDIEADKAKKVERYTLYSYMVGMPALNR